MGRRQSARFVGPPTSLLVMLVPAGISCSWSRSCAAPGATSAALGVSFDKSDVRFAARRRRV
jgi:hypothetical protein